MSNLSSFSSVTTLLQTSNIIWQSVNLIDEVKINLQYDVHQGLLNIFVKNIGEKNRLPCQINILSEEEEDLLNSAETIFDREPKISYEISTTYIYDINHENETLNRTDFSETLIASSSSSSSCFDEHTLDNDDGYSTHSHDDIEQQQQLSLVTPSAKLLRPFFSSSYRYYSEVQYVSSIRRLMEQSTWLSPFKKTMQQMMMNHLFL